VDPMNGLIAVALSGVSAGAFPMPGKRIASWRWEHIWAVYSLVAMGLLPIALMVVFAPGTISRLIGSNRELSLQVGAFGMLFGVGSVLFGVSLARLGMAITNALVSGIIVFLGSLGPLLTRSVHIDSKHLLRLVLGLSILVASLVLCAGASISRDRIRRITAPHPQSRFMVAICTAVLAGIFSSMLNIGFAFGGPLAENALLNGCPRALATVVIWIPALLGGLILNVGYPLYLIGRRNSWRLLVSGPTIVTSWLLASLMGILWFGNILLYGYGALVMGTNGSVYGWALSSAASILTSNVLGALAGEWDGAGIKAKTMMLLATVLLICSFAFLSMQSAPA